MSKVLVEDYTLSNIAEAIREKTGNGSSMLPSEMHERIYNIDTEKVTIDDYKVTEKMNLYSYQNQAVLEVEAPTPLPSGYFQQGKLYDGSTLYMKTTVTDVTDGSSSSSAGCTGTVLLIKPDGVQLSVDIPTYTIPSRSETGSSPDYYRYNYKLYLSPDEEVYLILVRIFRDYDDSNKFDHKTEYWSIYKLNISSSSLSWTNKVIELSLGELDCDVNNLIIENDRIYVGGIRTTRSNMGYNIYTAYIYGYKYGNTSYQFQTVSTNSIPATDIANVTMIFMRKNTNTYILFCEPHSNYTLTSNWISVTRNSDGTYTENKGTTASLRNEHKLWTPFMLNGDIYISMLGYGGNSGFEGFHIYKLNSDNSAWEVVYNIENATSYNTRVPTYLNNTPDAIFQGSDAYIIRNDGTFDLIDFSPGTLYYSQVPTPTIVMRDNETWYYNSYRYDDIGHKIFFFTVKTDYISYRDSLYKCVVEAMDGSPVLYSTFSLKGII